MKIGVVYPQTETMGDPDEIRRFIRATEELGYDYMLVYDHVLKATHAGREPRLTGPYTERDSFHDPFALFAFAAALSEKLEFATGVLVLPQRQTALVAQQAADVDLLSRERLRLGVGVGWNYVEYAALGQDFHTRGKRLDEQISLLRQLWASPLVTFTGRFDRIDRAGINPRPRRQIPIWVGGYSEPAYLRGARFGDGFIFAGGTDVLRGLGRVRHHLSEFGRSGTDFGFELSIHGKGNPEEAADAVEQWRQVGGTHACVPSMGLGFGREVDAHIDFFAKLRRRICAG